MNCDLLIHSVGQLLTLAGGPQRGESLGRLGLIEDGAVAISEGLVLEAGASQELVARYTPANAIDAGGRVALPGFVDAHTHLIWMGDRSAEFEMRVGGATYMEIMQAGGGIASTVQATRAASVEELVAAARPRLRSMLAHGTTTAEVKSGYGLETKAEIRMLEAVLKLDAEGPVELAPTFLGAHAVPTEYSGQTDDYVDLIRHDMLPALSTWWQGNAGGRPLPFVDVFCEEGVFDLGQSRAILEAGQELGFPLKIHADEFVSLGGARLAAELGAVSADHLIRTPPADIEALAGSKTVAVALPATPFGLGEAQYAPAGAFLRAGAMLALGSDLNPGTAWCESMPFVLALASRSMRLTPAQAIAAATINAAAAIGREARLGSLEPGKQADIVLVEAPDYRHLAYRFGTNPVSTVIKKGKVVFDRASGGG